MEKEPFEDVLPIFKMAMFHRHVSLPEGKFKNIRFPTIRRRFLGEKFEGFEFPNLRSIRNIEISRQIEAFLEVKRDGTF